MIFNHGIKTLGVCFAAFVGCSAPVLNDIDNNPSGVAASLAGGSVIRRVTQITKCMDVRGASSANGTAVQIYDCNGTQAQSWTAAGGTLKVLGNKCLDVANAVTTNGTHLQIADCTGSVTQQFAIHGNEIVLGSTHKCVDLPSGNSNNSMPLQLWDCVGNNNQLWAMGDANQTPSPPAVPSACKRGLAYGYNSVADLKALSPGVSWWYNWAAKPDNNAVAAAYASLGFEYEPMLWNGSFDANSMVSNPLLGSYLLAFNEPNFTSQANLTPQQAANLWPQVERIAHAHQMKIVAPAVNYCGGGCNVTDPFQWLDQFFAACPTCQVDYIAMHWYACDKSALQWYLGQFESRYNKPLWLTEFSCLDSATINTGVEATYMQDALAVLEGDPNVFRYAWFTGRSTAQPAINLLAGDGQLTPLGKIYVSAPQACKAP